MADLKTLLKKQKELEVEIDRARKEAQTVIKRKINTLLKEAEMTIQDAFPELAGGTGPKAKVTASKERQAGTPKYIANGKPIDGRTARRDPAFESVRVSGKIDDKKAQAAGKINPQWIKKQQKSVLKKLGLKA